jgi:hypothetical protein
LGADLAGLAGFFAGDLADFLGAFLGVGMRGIVAKRAGPARREVALD